MSRGVELCGVTLRGDGIEVDIETQFPRLYAAVKALVTDLQSGEALQQALCEVGKKALNRLPVPGEDLLHWLVSTELILKAGDQ